MKILQIAAALVAFAAPSFACDFKTGDIVADHPFGYAVPAGARAAGGFMTISNNGETDDRLIAVEADFPRVELHNHMIDANGVAKMFEMEDGIEIPAGSSVALAPGGLHVMFMGLDGAGIPAGEEIAAVLVFEQAGRLEVVFKITERPAGQGHGHGHSHGDGHTHTHGDGHSHSHSDNN